VSEVPITDLVGIRCTALFDIVVGHTQNRTYRTRVLTNEAYCTALNQSFGFGEAVYFTTE
jgi:hypothetical protein